ncbi:MAPEG family protein [Pseudooceanicola antarcticus]|uniref:MAPEG family protein n=1 Tax=Pseudooceanicola antarcticus TaxID=1247613 RepID=A0A285IKA1_9RHOB|nr:MAPEG family protein [Pseudooceanicola antarcticus]PJE28736.1 MAPEG family protein [Pseudooceanicola antarcticus]SNY48384.1 MAPEG family protein [Pseudooceanicola antarcticus]
MSTLPTEVTVLALAGLLQVCQIGLMSVTANLELDKSKTLGPRDPGRLGKPLVEQVSARTGRIFRAMDNHFEALILFTIAVAVVTLGQASSPLTATCAWIYLGARILYVPAYAFGWVPWRSLLWLTGLIASALMILATLF